MGTIETYPMVAIVIVNWNKKGYVLNLLKSLEAINYKNCEIIVVDNASTDGSAEEIKKEFPFVELVINRENLGGTGGFNTGMRYAVEKGIYKYIWLLDNDAEVEKDTLIELVRVMERDYRIGIAGSRIIDKDDNNVTVECGAYIRKDAIGVIPCYRNLKKLPYNEPVDVDYVAICSALVRIEALSTVGIMDERYFLFWDDMDWGWSFKDNGYRVLGVPNSIVYHPTFTERDRDLLTNFYYGVRNAMLTYARHLQPIKILKVFYNYIRYFCRSAIFLFISGEKIKVTVLLTALKDFYIGRWGKPLKLACTDRVSRGNPKKVLDINEFVDNKKQILVIGLKASREDLYELRKGLGHLEDNITLLIQDDRYEIYKDSFMKILIFESKKVNSLFYNIKLFATLFLSRYDIAISTGLNPFLCVSKKRLIFKDSEFNDVSNKINICLLILITLTGELMALLITPFLVLRAKRYRKWAGLHI